MAKLVANTILNITRLLKSRLEDFHGESRRSYQKGFLSFYYYIIANYNLDDRFSPEVVQNWYLDMRLQGLSEKSARFYLDKVASLYGAVESSIESPCPMIFKNFKSELKKINTSLPFSNIINETLRKLIKFCGDTYKEGIGKSVERDLIIFSLLNGAFSLKEIINLNKTDYDSAIAANNEIAEAYANKTRKYLFPLTQSEKGINRILKNLEPVIKDILANSGLPVHGSIDDCLHYLWACAALRCGVKGTVVRARLNEVPASLQILQVCIPENDSHRGSSVASRAVALLIGGDTRQWFAMRLRPKVRYGDLLQRFVQLQGNVKMPELFYPSEEIGRRVGKKFIWEDKPVIRDVVFFKSRMAEILPLFHHLYDIAWCYKNPGSGVGNYAVISEKAMSEFRKAIGLLDSGMEVLPSGEMELNPGDRVVVVTGDYIDHKGRILSLSKDPDSDNNVIYRVVLSDVACNWTISIDARKLRKL